MQVTDHVRGLAGREEWRLVSGSGTRGLRALRSGSGKDPFTINPDSSIEIIDLRSLVPLDRDTVLGSVRKTHRLLVVHEAIKRAGYGGEIAAIVAEEAFDDLDAPPRRLAGLETPIPYAQHLEKTVVPQAEDIVRVARELVA